MAKFKFWRFAKSAAESVSRPVVWSSVAPVRFVYVLKASVARSVNVVPVSTMPAVWASTAVLSEPYVTVYEGIRHVIDTEHHSSPYLIDSPKLARRRSRGEGSKSNVARKLR